MALADIYRVAFETENDVGKISLRSLDGNFDVEVELHPGPSYGYANLSDDHVEVQAVIAESKHREIARALANEVLERRPRISVEVETDGLGRNGLSSDHEPKEGLTKLIIMIDGASHRLF